MAYKAYINEMISEKRAGLERWYLGNGLTANPTDEQVLDVWSRRMHGSEYKTVN